MLRQKAPVSFKKQLDIILGETDYQEEYALMDQMTFIHSTKFSHVLIILLKNISAFGLQQCQFFLKLSCSSVHCWGWSFLTLWQILNSRHPCNMTILFSIKENLTFSPMTVPSLVPRLTTESFSGILKIHQQQQQNPSGFQN